MGEVRKRRRELDRLSNREYAEFDGEPTDEELVSQFMTASGLSRDLAWMVVWFVRYDHEHPALWTDILYHVPLIYGTDRRRRLPAGEGIPRPSAASL